MDTRPWLTSEEIADALYGAGIIDATQRDAFVAEACRPREVSVAQATTTYSRLHEDGSIMYEADCYGNQIGPTYPPSGTPDEIERAAKSFERQQGYRPSWAPRRSRLWWRR